MAAVGGVVSTTMYIIVGLTISKALLRHMYAVNPLFLVVTGGSGALVGLCATRSFRRYNEMPEAAGPYRSRSAVRLLNILYVAISVAWAWLMGGELRMDIIDFITARTTIR
jgi:flagellar motor component MotA